jgi:hypothetical protein
MNIMLSSKQVSLKIRSIKTSKTAIFANVQDVIIAGLEYANESKDTGILTRLFAAMPKQFSVDVIAYVSEFSPLNYSEKTSAFKIGTKRDWQIDEAKAILWHKFNASNKIKTVNYDKYKDATKLIDAAIKAIESDFEKVKSGNALSKGSRDTANKTLSSLKNTLKAMQQPKTQEKMAA